jgi:signal transduction histidine kinase/CheY-like chemotaxis protein
MAETMYVGGASGDDQMFARVTQAFIPALLSAARISSGQLIHDVATGTGAAANAARDLVGAGREVSAGNISSTMLDVARRNPQNSGIRFEQFDGHRLPYGCVMRGSTRRHRSAVEPAASMALRCLANSAMVKSLLKSNLAEHAACPVTRAYEGSIDAMSSRQVSCPIDANGGPTVEKREQLAASSEILRIISGATRIGGNRTDVQSVFDSIAVRALELCRGSWSAVELVEGNYLVLLSLHNIADRQALESMKASFPMHVASDTVAARVVRTGETACMIDMATQSHSLKDRALKHRYMAGLGVPMLHGGQVIGVIFVARDTPGEFPPSQVALLRNFADQAVIAIENIRLFDELQKKTQQLETLNIFKSRFLAAASHDLRQPLHALNLFLGQLQAEEDQVERNRLISNIDASVSSINDLFSAMLDMSKLDAGILAPEQEIFPIASVLKRLEITFTEAARRKGLRLKVLPSANHVRSDPILLERTLSNLIANAVRYTDKGGVLIGCRRRGAMIRIDVIDSGPGISPCEQERIFEEFYQVREPSRVGGLGLGLSIVERLCGLLDHKIELESRPGKGSRFSTLVPIASCIPEPQKPSALTAFVDPIRGSLIIIIDDDVHVLEAMRGLLVSWSAQVMCATSIDEAVGLLTRSKAPDLIIADYRLSDGASGIDGICTVRKAIGTNVPALLITADTARERLQEAAAAGHILLHKPISPMALRTAITRLLTNN